MPAPSHADDDAAEPAGPTEPNRRAEAPLDPRRAPDVVLALARASKRDPHPDVFKPVGRASFLIWMAIVATLVLVFSPARGHVPLPQFRSAVAHGLHSLFGDSPAPRAVLKTIDHNPNKLAVAAVTGFAGGTLLFALYYFTVYLVVMNARRLVNGTALAIRSGVRRAQNLADEIRAKRKGSARIIVERPTAAGPEPSLQ